MVFHCGNIVEKVLPKAGGSEKRQKGRGHVRGLSIGGVSNLLYTVDLALIVQKINLSVEDLLSLFLQTNLK